MKQFVQNIKNFNWILNVSDAVSPQSTDGFIDGNTDPTLNDYEYDLNGNMIKDRNKDITEIKYNHLNLPTQITWDNNRYISYQYNAAGQKVRKTVDNNDSLKIVDYLDGFQTEERGSRIPVGALATQLSNNEQYHSTSCASFNFEIFNFKNFTCPFGLRHEIHYPSSRNRYFRAAEGLGGGQIGDRVELVNVTKTEYNYKYSGKELQDELGLDWYDYGARNYDAAIGRFFNLDRLSEKYEAISPYGYVANNPVRYIDINGEWIYIDDGEKKYRYENGQTQHQIDGEWTTIDETVQLSDYAVGMVAQLNTLESSGATGAGLIDHFSNDKNNVTIMSGANNEYNNGVITYNLDRNAKVFTQDGYSDMPHYVGIGHELGHAKDPNNYYSGLGGEWYPGVSRSEIYASHIENMIRAESGLSLRRHYGSITNSAGDRILPNPASALIDKKGNSIFYTWDGKQRDFNLSIGISKAVYGGEIIKSRMKVNINRKQTEVRGFPYNYPSQNGKK